MSSIPTEKKMELVHQVRSQYNQNQYDLSNRERILYGHSTARPQEDYQDRWAGYAPADDQDQEPPVSTFRLRLLLALAIGIGFILLDGYDMKVAGISTEQVFEAIAVDYGDFSISFPQPSQTLP